MTNQDGLTRKTILSQYLGLIVLAGKQRCGRLAKMGVPHYTPIWPRHNECFWTPARYGLEFHRLADHKGSV